ncbi:MULTISPECIES: tetratricopeptide repeat protein [Zhongshania]|uniref:Flp pilus assembly protein TadD n=1 Tax=Zhongshania antarctica TaxID=641702 RepID=A0A840R8E0_9GAMM|nr:MULTISPECIES: tetratricopeptide repeat protein [Zhongshania]MBB5189147.1 Flp pilus assembly protein TadD [Zhongshania antarctica]
MKIKSPSSAIALAIFISGVGSLAPGCASSQSQSSVQIDPPPANAVANLLNNDIHPITAKSAFSPEENILAIDADMRYFVEENVPAALSPRARLSYLLDAMVRPSQLGLSYDPGITFNATETFYARKGNCLSLSSLFIALAREANLNAYYNEVTIPPSWDMVSDNSMVFYKHINVVVDFGEDGQEIVDLSVDNYEYHYPQHRLSEQEAAAQHYNNRGAEFLNQGKNDEAMRYFHRALYLDPQAGHIWGNLGTLFRRLGHQQDAELAYRQALTLNINDQVAISNLSRLYREQGDTEKARELEKVAEEFRKENPFWHYTRAKAEYEKGEYANALQAIKHAIALRKNEHRFYRFASLIYFRQGKRDLAVTYAEKAAKLKVASSANIEN